MKGNAGPGVSFTTRDVVDAYRIFAIPVALGAGTPLFHGLRQRATFKLVNPRNMMSGVMPLTYQPT